MMKRMIHSLKDGIAGAFSCFALLVTLNTDLSEISAQAAGGGFFTLLAVNIKKLEYLLPDFTYRDALLVFLLFYFFVKAKPIWDVEVSRWSYRVPAGLTSFFLLFGYSFRYTNSWDLIFMDTFHRLVSLLMLIGFYLLFARIYALLIRKLCHVTEENAAAGSRLGNWIFEKHAFWGAFLVILLFWLPYIIAKFPGAAMPETLAEMRQWYWNMINNYYPPLHTVLMCLVMELGNLLVSYMFGFFLNLVLQLGLLLSAFSYGFVLMKRWRTPHLFRAAALTIICIVQYFPMESTIVEKDVPYAACVIFLVLMLFELIRTMKAEEPLSCRWVIAYILAAFGTAGFRNEGIYLVLFSGIAVAVYAARLLWKENRKKCTRVLTAMLLPVLLVLLYQRVLLPACGVEDNGVKEALSIPFQQTARYVRDYGYELTEEDEEIISHVLDAENLAELYDPVTSDPVKATYHAEFTEDLMAYFGLWFRQLLRHPGNAVEATMNNAYGWFYQEGYAQNYMMTSKIEGQDIRWEITQPAFLDGFRNVMERVAKLLSRVPVVNWFENAGVVSWMTILLTAFYIGSGRKRYLLPMVPLLTALLVCIAAPTFNYQVRYIMPVMFCVPFYAAMALASGSEAVHVRKAGGGDECDIDGDRKSSP
ncbi:MAG: DUF6020 family protein [Lachnospiraceae bacterium]|nr:DUF6020 family protein [Lachnospiraceae bacterium]